MTDHGVVKMSKLMLLLNILNKERSKKPLPISPAFDLTSAKVLPHIKEAKNIVTIIFLILITIYLPYFNIQLIIALYDFKKR